MSKIYYDNLLRSAEFLIKKQKYEVAREKLQEAVQRNRLCVKANYLLAYVSLELEDYLEAYRYFTRTSGLQQCYKENFIAPDVLAEQIALARNQCTAVLEQCTSDEREVYERDYKQISAADAALESNIFRTVEPVDQYCGIHQFDGKQYFLGHYDDWMHTYLNARGEMHCAYGKVESYEVMDQKQEILIQDDLPCVVPAVFIPTANNIEVTQVQLESSTEEASMRVAEYDTFQYFRVSEPTCIKVESGAYFAKPISLKHEKKNKKLILNIFLDSFNWKVIKDRSLQECMPHTARFFADGLCCEQFYAGSEFTYPSVASYWTGLRSTHHTMLNPNVHFSIPSEIPVLPEIFHDQGYFTAKIGGNTSVLPNYGYHRGIDRFLYEKWEQNFHVHEVVGEVMEHLETFGEADNFIWMEIQDLHDVATYWKMPISVEAASSLAVNEIDNEGGYSLYQTYSPHRCEVYLKQLKRIDQYLENLYHYIMEKYSREEVIITLFSDHGNGSNVEHGQPFMSEQRLNVPLLIAGPAFAQKSCNELIESIDYGHILCSLAGISDPRIDKNDGILPGFFGGQEQKKYVFAQCLHPDRHYEAHIISEDYRFYFKSTDRATNDCRIALRGAYSLTDNNGNEIQNDAIVQACMAKIKEYLGDYEMQGENG